MNEQFVLKFKTSLEKDGSIVVPYADLTKTPTQIKAAMQSILTANIFSTEEAGEFTSLGAPYSVRTAETSVTLA